MDYARSHEPNGKRAISSPFNLLVTILVALGMTCALSPAGYADPLSPNSQQTVYSQADGYEPYSGWQSILSVNSTTGGGTTNSSGYVNWMLIDPVSDGVTVSDGTVWSAYSGSVNVVTDVNATKADADVPYFKNVILPALDLDSNDDGVIDGADTVTLKFTATMTGGRLFEASNAYQNYDASKGTGGIVVSTSANPEDWANPANIVWTGTSSNTQVDANGVAGNWARLATFTISSSDLQKAGDKPLYFVIEKDLYSANAIQLCGNIVFQMSTTTDATWSGSRSTAGAVYSQGQGTIVMTVDESRKNLVRDLTTTSAYMNRFTKPVAVDDDGNTQFFFNATGSGANWVSASTWQRSTHKVYAEDPIANPEATVVDGASISITNIDSSRPTAGVCFSVSGLEGGHTYYLEIPAGFAVSNSLGRRIIFEFTPAFTALDNQALETTISSTRNLADSVVISADGNDVPSSKYWATQASVDTLNAAIDSAQEIHDNGTVATASLQAMDADMEISGAIDSLQTAAETFKVSRARGNVDPAKLQAAIADAQDYYDALYVSVDGADVSVNDTWCTQAEKDALKTVIDAANEALASENPTAEIYDNAITALQNAMNIAKQGLRDNVVKTWEIGASDAAAVTANLHEGGTLRFEGTGDCASYTAQTQVPWYTSRSSIKAYQFEEGVAPLNIDYWFGACANLAQASELPASVTSMKSAFSGCTSLTTAPAIPSNAQDMSRTFSGCTSLAAAPAMPNTVMNLSWAFQGCSKLTSVPNISLSATDMSNTFMGCAALASVPDIPSTVASLTSTFQACTSLATAPAIPSGVTDLANTFSSCSALTTAPVIPEGVTNMQSTFASCASLTTAPAIPSSVTNMQSTFASCTSLAKAPAIPEGVTSMSSTFQMCSSLVEAPSLPSTIKDLSSTFNYCSLLVNAPAIPDGVTNMQQTFNNCPALVEAPAIPNSVTNMQSTFANCTSLKSAPNVSSAATDMTYTFRGCSSLTEAPAIPDSVTTLQYTFQECTSLVHAPAISESSSLTNMTYAFYGCSSLVDAPVIPSRVTNMSYTFGNCASLKTAPLMPSGVTQRVGTFRNCTSLTALSEGMVIPIPSYPTYGNFTFDVGDPYGPDNLLKTYITGPADSSVSGFDWTAANRELVVLPAGLSAESVAALDNALALAAEQLDSIVRSADGADLPNGTTWVSPDVYDALSAAVVPGKSMHDAICDGSSTATTQDVDNMVGQLKAATDAVIAAAQTVSVDTTALSSAIEAAKADAAATAVEGDVAPGAQYVSAAEAKAFADAIEAAEGALSDGNLTQASVNAALAALKEAQAAFDSAKKIQTISIASATVSGLSGLAYTGSGIAPSISVKVGETALAAGTDYDVSYAPDGSVKNNGAALDKGGLPLAVGSYVATITGKGAYEGTVTKSFVIDRASVADAKVTLDPASAVYTGKAIEPKVTVVLGGKTLAAGTDYDVAYANNVNVGKASVTVTGKGNYTGEAKASFDITRTADPADPSNPGSSDEPGTDQPAEGQAMYRLYNPNSGEHFYTASTIERDAVIAAGWNDEGIGWTAPASGIKVYRLYNSFAGEHHYTKSEVERDSLIAAGWTWEEGGWYSDPSESVPLYRAYNPNAYANNHNYTTSAYEHQYLLSLGWQDEGIGWHGIG